MGSFGLEMMLCLLMRDLWWSRTVLVSLEMVSGCSLRLYGVIWI